PELKKIFEEIKTEYESQGADCRYLLAVPRLFFSCSGLFLMKRRVYFSSWPNARYYFKKNFRKDRTYGDAFLFEKANKDMYFRLWDNGKNVLFVHNNKQYADIFRSMYHKTVYFMECPPQNAFEQMDELEKKIKLCMDENCLTADNTDIILSAGPAGKVLVYKLSEEGYRCIDAGHCWDDPLEIK
ncbi:MAG: hypothetical protein K0S55_1403, partial [Clostridia bacterium]|nr:hypothetical protein [Clostridia bacterium]